MRKIRIYAEGEIFPVSPMKMVEELKRDFGIDSIWEGYLFSGMDEEMKKAIAYEMAKMRVKDPRRKVEREPLPMEIRYEERKMEDGSSREGPIYEGFTFVELLNRFFPFKSRAVLPVLITDRLIATFDADGRYHLRTCVLTGMWNLLSVSGLVHAPAKPREYYFIKGVLGDRMDEVARKEVENLFDGMVLKKGHPALHEAAKSLLLQAVFYSIFGEEFCNIPDCRLYNPHWQEEVFRALVKERGELGLCEKHIKMLEVIKHDQN